MGCDLSPCVNPIWSDLRRYSRQNARHGNETVSGSSYIWAFVMQVMVWRVCAKLTQNNNTTYLADFVSPKTLRSSSESCETSLMVTHSLQFLLSRHGTFSYVLYNTVSRYSTVAEKFIHVIIPKLLSILTVESHYYGPLRGSIIFMTYFERTLC